MPLCLEITSYQRKRLKRAAKKEFGTEGGSIGRSLESDWVLLDGKRYVSSQHASIDFRSGSYYIVDTSSNGVYVNDEARPIGKATPQRLFDGDRLRMGAYEMVAHITESDAEREKLSDETHVDPVDRARFVADPEPTGHDLISAQELTAGGIETLLLDGAAAEALKRAASTAAACEQLEAEEAKPPSKAKIVPSKSVSGSHGPKASGDVRNRSTSVALYAFCRGAGLRPRELDEQQATFMLHRLGRFMRELIIGLTDALHFRTEQTRKLRVPSAAIQSKSGNPQMFSAGVDETLDTLLSKPAAEYRSTINATREAFRDVKIHQEAMLHAMHVAMADFLERLDPDKLEQSVDHSMKRKTLIGASKTRRYWERYRDVFQAMARHSPGQFPQIFSAELCRAYEEETARLNGKRQTEDAAREVVTRLPQAKAS